MHQRSVTFNFVDVCNGAIDDSALNALTMDGSCSAAIELRL